MELIKTNIDVDLLDGEPANLRQEILGNILLVGDFNPFQKICSSNWIISRSKG